jgi:Membrane bound O-acyl transferase family
MTSVTKTRSRVEAVPAMQPGPRQSAAWPGWIPLIVLPFLALSARSHLNPWSFMWILASTIFLGCKWQTLWQQRAIARAKIGRAAAYLFCWPGMNAEGFLDPRTIPQQPQLQEWLSAIGKTLLGTAFVWGTVRMVPAAHDLWAGWIGMLGMILILHFGGFHILSLLWRSAGVDAPPLMQAPLSATSLSEFWGRRWNLGFRQLTHDLIFRPARRRFGPAIAVLLAFLASGLIHDLVISLPASGGYGLPTAYFALQGLCVLIERGKAGQALRLSSGVPGRLFAALCTIAPLPLLFHAPFVRGVILPFLAALGAR